MWGAMATELAHQPDDLAAMADSVRCPFLILVGEEDKPFMTASREMVDAIPAAQLVVIPDAGHSPQFENPPAWINALSSFLAAVPAIAS
jgi:3-oxoadipate enol-lactonase